MLVYRNAAPIGKLIITDRAGTRLFEILGQGQQFVGFGRHPAGMDYRSEDDDPTSIAWADLPEVTPEQLHTNSPSIPRTAWPQDCPVSFDNPNAGYQSKGGKSRGGGH
jgi:hypothetical protein